MKLLFGTAGVPRSAKSQDTISGLRRIKELGLDTMELEFVHGVRMGDDLARQVNQVRRELGLHLTVHGPYFINLNAKEPAKVTASQQRIYDSARIGALCGAESVTFHAGFYLDSTPDETFRNIKHNLGQIVERLKDNNIKIILSPELSGKQSQFGSLDELIKLADESSQIRLCIDFAHQHARTNGKFNTYDEFAGMLDTIKNGLGKDALTHLHIHTSGIKYSAKGEREHLELKDSDFNYKDLMKALKDYKAGGFLTCESPNLEEDALLMKQMYERI